MSAPLVSCLLKEHDRLCELRDFKHPLTLSQLELRMEIARNMMLIMGERKQKENIEESKKNFEEAKKRYEEEEEKTSSPPTNKRKGEEKEKEVEKKEKKEMKITIQKLTGEKFDLLGLSPTDTIKNVRNMIKHHPMGSIYDFRLIFGGEVLEDGLKSDDAISSVLSDYKIQDGSVFNMMRIRKEKETDITVRNMFETDATTTIQHHEGYVKVTRKGEEKEKEVEKKERKITICDSISDEKFDLFNILPTTTGRDVKKMIRLHPKGLRGNIRLDFLADEFTNDTTFAHYWDKLGSADWGPIYMLGHMPGMLTTIKTLTGKSFDLTINASDTVQKLRRMVQKKGGYPTDQQRLVFEGKEFEDGHTMSDYGIQHDSEITLILRLCGAKPVIYIYNSPWEGIDVKVMIASKIWVFSSVYPTPLKLEIDDAIEWKVKPQDDGMLLETSGGTVVPYLFWDALTCDNTPFLEWYTHKHFSVRTNDAPKFFEAALKFVGLNARERTDFITFWIHRWRLKNHINVTFLTEKQYESVAQLYPDPIPKKVIRVFILFKCISKDESDDDWDLEQDLFEDDSNLKQVDREKYDKDYLVVEWGGMEMNF